MIRRPPRSPLFPSTTLFRSKLKSRPIVREPGHEIVKEVDEQLNRHALAFEPLADVTSDLGWQRSDERRVVAVDQPILVADHHRSEEHTSELQSQSNLVCRLL